MSTVSTTSGSTTTGADATSRASRKHIPALDGVRGLAVLMVVIYHSSHVPSGDLLLQAFALVRSMLWIGVDLFFVLSGFLITRILISTHDSPQYFRSFYVRRTVRIFPLYYGVLFALFVGLPAMAWLVGGPIAELTASGAYRQLADHQVWLWTYLQNFFQARGPTGQPGAGLPGLGHFWSLAIEEQFYLVWPAMIWLVARGKNLTRRVVMLCCVIITATLAIRSSLVFSGAEPWAIFHWTFTRCDALAWGALAAALVTNARFRVERRRCLRVALAVTMAGWLVGGVIAGGWGKLSPPIQTAGYSLIAAAFACWILRITTGSDRQQGTWLCSPWLMTLGKYSYAMYVFHWPLCRGVEAVLQRGGILASTGDIAVIGSRLLQTLLVLAISFALAWISWHAWEKHWLRLKRFAPY